MGDVDIGSDRFDDSDRQNIGPVDDTQMRRCACLVSEAAQHRECSIPENRLNLSRQSEDTETESCTSIRTSTQQRMLLECDDKPVDDSARDTECTGEFRHRGPIRCSG